MHALINTCLSRAIFVQMTLYDGIIVLFCTHIFLMSMLMTSLDIFTIHVMAQLPNCKALFLRSTMHLCISRKSNQSLSFLVCFNCCILVSKVGFAEANGNIAYHVFFH